LVIAKTLLTGYISDITEVIKAMKLKIRHLILIGLLLPLIFISCKTTATPDSLSDIPKDLSGPADEAALSALAEARAKAEESRFWAAYVKGDTYYPEEWGVVENRYDAAAAQPDEPEAKADAYAAVIEWRGISAAYDDIYNKSAEQFAGEQQQLLAAAREAAVKAGAEELVPDRLAQADTVTASSKQKLESGDFTGAIKEGKDAQDRYKVLQTIAEAHTKQDEADNNDFFSRDPDNYMLAADAGNSAVEFYDAGDIAKAQEAADEALFRFTQVIKNGWASQVEEKALTAKEQRDAAEEVKANVAVRADFDAADRVYNQAHVALRAEEYAVASELFEQSEGLFKKAHDSAVVKRQVAEEALRQAEKKLAESEEKAQQAEEIIGGGE
jgi:hypothetical protein